LYPISIKGKIMMANVKPEANIDKPRFSLITKKAYPKRPNTMDGIPAMH